MIGVVNAEEKSMDKEINVVVVAVTGVYGLWYFWKEVKKEDKIHWSKGRRVHVKLHENARRLRTIVLVKSYKYFL